MSPFYEPTATWPFWLTQRVLNSLGVEYVFRLETPSPVLGSISKIALLLIALKVLKLENSAFLYSVVIPRTPPFLGLGSSLMSELLHIGG